MAIIYPPSVELSAREAIIAIQARPAILVRDGSLQLETVDPFSKGLLEQNRLPVERALRGVGRIEVDGMTQSFVSTAFIVDPSRAVTANYVAEALTRNLRPGAASSNGAGSLDGVWINLKSEYGSRAVERVPVKNVQFVHPYWGFAFLKLAREVELSCVLSTAPNQAYEGLHGRDVCVIGYPAFDVRNDSSALKAIFEDIFEVKRVMPGKITGTGRWGIDQTRVLHHDATTTGGTAGAPLVDLTTGRVLGIQVGGSAEANYAVPAWEIRRDPQWFQGSPRQAAEELRSPAVVARQSIEANEDADTNILEFDEVLQLYQMLVKIGVTDQDKIQILLLGLPKEYVGALPQTGASPADRLLAMLHGMNEIGGRIGRHSAFYFVLKNAEQMRSWDATWTQKTQALLALLLRREVARDQ